MRQDSTQLDDAALGAAYVEAAEHLSSLRREIRRRHPDFPSSSLNAWAEHSIAGFKYEWGAFLILKDVKNTDGPELVRRLRELDAACESAGSSELPVTRMAGMPSGAAVGGSAVLPVIRMTVTPRGHGRTR